MTHTEYLSEAQRLHDHLEAALLIADRLGLAEPLRLLPARTCKDIAHDMVFAALSGLDTPTPVTH